MADKKDLREELLEQQGRALVKAGRDAARRVYDDLTLSDDEKAIRKAERAREAKLKRYKWIAIGAFALIALITLFVIVAKLWLWIVALALVAALVYGLYAYGRKKLAGVRVSVSEDANPAPPREGADVSPREAEPDPRIAAEARERAIDDELAALKAKTKVNKP